MVATSTVRRYIAEVARRGRGEAPLELGQVQVPACGDLDEYMRIAREHADIGTVVSTKTRLRGLKVLMERLSRHFTHHQVAFNHSILDAVKEVDAAVAGVDAAVKGAATVANRGATAVAGMDVLIQDLTEQVDELQQQNRSMADELGQLRSGAADSRSAVRMLRSMLDVALAELRTQDAEIGSEASAAAGSRRLAIQRHLEARHDDFYSAFENTFRGSRDQIKILCKEYVDELAIAAAGTTGKVLDVGCGRGELLEVLRQAGVPAYGVDSNETFVSSTRAIGLDVVHADAVAHLRAVPESHLAAVTGLHIAEHLDLDALIDLVDAALRAVAPGGRLLLETPNPQTWQVGANYFYLDPTHIKPLHPLFLHFLLTARGFVDVTVRYLHPADGDRLPLPRSSGEDPALRELFDRFNDVYAGPQDYAVSGAKPGPVF